MAMRDLVNALGRAKAAEQAWLKRTAAEAVKNRGGNRYNAWARQGEVDIDAYRNAMGGNPHASKIQKLVDQIRQMRAGGGATTSNSSAAPGLGLPQGLEGLLSAYQSMQQAQQPSLADQLSYEFYNQLQAANAANEARYQEGKGELTDLRERSMADMANVGQQQAADIDRNFRNASGQVQQSLSRRGLLGTSVVGSEARRLEEGRAGAQNRLAEQLALARIGADQSLTGNIAGWIERRNDVAPELSQLMALQQGLGASGMAGTLAGMMGGNPYGMITPGGFPLGSNPGQTQMPGILPSFQQQGATGAGGGMALRGNTVGRPTGAQNALPGLDPNRLLYSPRDPVMSGIQTLLTQQLSQLTSGGNIGRPSPPPLVGPTVYSRPTTSGMSIARPGGMMMGAPVFAGAGMFAPPSMAFGQAPTMMPGVTSNWRPGQRPPRPSRPSALSGGGMTIPRPGGHGYGVSTPVFTNPGMYA